MRLPERIINAENQITVTRTLPVDGEVLVHPGLRVDALDVVAHAEIPRRYRVIDVARELAQPNVDMNEVMLKRVGQHVTVNEVIATAGGGLPFLQRSARAPADGIITAIGPGWVQLETERAVVQVQAFVNGVVSKIIPGRGAVIESKGAKIEAVAGFGGEAYGRLQRLVTAPSESLSSDMLTEEVAQAIVLGGCSVDEAVLRKAEAMHVRGIIVGSFDAALLKLDPPVKVRVVATEGFGSIPISPYTFNILNTLIGREISIRGQSGLRTVSSLAETASPVILSTTVYGSRYTKPVDKEEPLEIKVGSHVRVTQGHLLGATGHVDTLPTAPQPTESGIEAMGAYITIDSRLHFIPWANLEQVK